MGLADTPDPRSDATPTGVSAHSGVRVDWQSVCLDLNVFFSTPGKTSYGQGELQKLLAASIGQHTVPEDRAARAVRLYVDDLFRNATDDAGGRESAFRDPRAVTSIDRPGEPDEEGVPHGSRERIRA